MKPAITGLVLVLGLALPAQDKRAGEDLPRFRAAFATLPVTGPIAVIACARGGEPVILTAGREVGGLDLSAHSLLPLLGLGKLLAADAIAAQQRDKLDQGSGEKFGGRELTVRELLEGTALLPDYFVLDGGDGSADAAMLRACGDLAASARLQMSATTLGAAEFVLLERLAFTARYPDWPSMVRSILAPRVPGLDPRSADALQEDQRSRLAFDPQYVAQLAAARPALLRTALSLTDLTMWWQWRVQQGAQLWSGARMGRTERAMTRPDEQRWTFSALAMNCSVSAIQYPKQKAGVLWIGPASTAHRAGAVMQAFEIDLFGGPGARAAATERVKAAAGAVVVVTAPENTLNMGLLAGSRWRSDDGAPACTLACGARSLDPMLLTLGQGAVPFHLRNRAGDAFTASARSDDGVQRSLWLWPLLDDVRQTTRLGAVLVTTRGAQVGASVPQCVYLLPETK